MKTMNEIILTPKENLITPESITRRCTVTRLKDNQVTEESELWFELPNSITPSESLDCDSYVCAMLMDAMAESASLTIKGSVSRSLLSNLCEYQGAWNKWLPDIFSLIEIKAEQIRDDSNTKVEGAVCAFSGGVDACFTVWRHYFKKCSHQAKEIQFCILIHGYDIPLSNQEAFDESYRTAKQTLDSLNLDLKIIKSNFREISKAKWKYTHAAAFIAAFSQAKEMTNECLFASSEPYDALIYPWGTNPITDHLLGSNNFKVFHDGAAFSRSEKVACLPKWPEALKNLRVCWESTDAVLNCGKCEKCLRTMINFLANGLPVPDSMSNSSELIKNMQKIRLKSRPAINEWQTCLAHAQKNNIKGKWLKTVKNLIFWSKFRNAFTAKRRRFKYFLKSIYLWK